jgi:hypothetical protein
VETRAEYLVSGDFGGNTCYLVSGDFENTSRLHGKLSGLRGPHPEPHDLDITSVRGLEPGLKLDPFFSHFSSACSSAYQIPTYNLGPML